MGFDIHTSPNPVLQPISITCWKENHSNKKVDQPFYFKTDVLTGLSLILLNQNSRNPFSEPLIDYPDVSQCWLSLEPHYEIFLRSQHQINKIRDYFPTTAKPLRPPSSQFESSLTEILSQSMSACGVNLQPLGDLIVAADDLEHRITQPLLYNFSLQFSKKTVQILQYLHSLLFHLRALMAAEFNTQIQDPTFESLKMDSITDYLPKCEYVTNDALIYHKFCHLVSQMPKTVAENLAQAFLTYNHDSTCLVNGLPPSFLRSIPPDELEDTLYFSQIEWLLGTEAGLLFRIREEIYGLTNGYHKIFWTDLEGRTHQPCREISINCELTHKVPYLDVG